MLHVTETETTVQLIVCALIRTLRSLWEMIVGGERDQSSDVRKRPSVTNTHSGAQPETNTQTKMHR